MTKPVKTAEFPGASFSRRSGTQRYKESHFGAEALAAVGPDLTAGALNHVLDDRQSQAGAAQASAAGLVNTVEPFEDVGQVFGVDADTIVPDHDPDLSAFLFSA